MERVSRAERVFPASLFIDGLPPLRNQIHGLFDTQFPGVDRVIGTVRINVPAFGDQFGHLFMRFHLGERRARRIRLGCNNALSQTIGGSIEPNTLAALRD